jgi:S-formylglutathione hydrolase FrmB
VAVAGRWHELSIESEALRGNALGDPHVRPLFVWTPPAYDAEPERRFPSVYLLQGLTGQARAWFNMAPFAKGFPELLEEAGVEAVVVLLDAFTAVGGSQFVDSPAIGRYGTYFTDEVVPLVDARFRTLAQPAHRGVQGKSSGGYGAMVWGMLRPDLFGAFATHAGDALFEVSLAREFAPAAQALRNLYDGSFDAFWEDFRSGRPVLSNATDHVLLAPWAYAAAYSANEDGSVDLPFRLDTGELVPEVWERWLAWDPVRMAASHGEALRAARGIWIDAGRNDEYLLDLGAVAFRQALADAGVADERVYFELFEGTHRALNWRYPLSLAFLAERLA